MTIALEMLFRELQEAHSFDEKFCLPVLARVGVATSLGRTGLPHRRLPKLFNHPPTLHDLSSSDFPLRGNWV
jgi:hypothetical protein